MLDPFDFDVVTETGTKNFQLLAAKAGATPCSGADGAVVLDERQARARQKRWRGDTEKLVGGRDLRTGTRLHDCRRH